MYDLDGKVTKISPKQDTFHKNLRFFIKNMRFFLQIPKKAVPLHRIFEMHPRLGYGVMVTLQILVLPFLVRVRVPQPKKSHSNEWLFSFSMD